MPPSLAGYLRNLGYRQIESVKTLPMDMNRAYISAARIHLPKAVEKIAFNHFHVTKMLCDVVDKTRQAEMRTISLQARKSAHHSRYLCLYGRHKRHGRIPEQRTIKSGGNVPLRQAKHGIMNLPP